MSEKVKVGVVSFTDPRSSGLASVTEQYNRRCHLELVKFLKSRGFEVIDPRKGLEVPAVGSLSGVRECVHLLRLKEAECLVIGCWTWTDPMLAVDLVRDLNIPTLLFAKSDVDATGVVCISAVGGGLWEVAPNDSAIRHKRVMDDFERVARWARGVGALVKMRQKSLLLWGGSYALRMEHLQDDPSKLKSFLIGDIMIEGQYLLIKRAEDIIKRRPGEIDAFIRWIEGCGANIVYDERMLTDESLRRQVALYLAARERLVELEGEDIAGVSIKCQPELSEEYGVTGCFIPSFLPFPEDHEGKRPIVPTTCEGDIKGLVTSVLMHLIEPKIPPAFGDIRHMEYDGRQIVMIGNCGGASIYYAGNSTEAGKVLPNVTIRGQCQGASGGAVGYYGVAGTATIARLIRIAGNYYMQIGVGETVDVNADMVGLMKWGDMWPQIGIDLGTDIGELMEIVGSNHYSLMPGDYSEEIESACFEAGIPVMRLDGDMNLDLDVP